MVRDNLLMKSKSDAATSQKKLPDGVVEWLDANGVVFKREIPSGQVQWCDENRRLHRDDGPALEGEDGTRAWFQHGKEHREGAPAIEDSTGKYWFRNGKRHRDDGPAIERADGTTEWWRNGRRLKPEQIKVIMEKNAEKIAEPFRKGLDHPIKVSAIGKLKTRPSPPER